MHSNARRIFQGAGNSQPKRMVRNECSQSDCIFPRHAKYWVTPNLMSITGNRAVRFIVLFCLAATLRTVAQPANGVYRELYLNITGGAVSNLTNAASFPNTPS